jgi:hypothetical protein
VGLVALRPVLRPTPRETVELRDAA